MTLKIKDLTIPIIAILVLSAFIVYSVNEASGTSSAFAINLSNDITPDPPIEVTGDPNTVIIFCEWEFKKDYVNCTKTNVWYQDYEIIKEETFSYQISVQDYKDGNL